MLIARRSAEFCIAVFATLALAAPAAAHPRPCINTDAEVGQVSSFQLGQATRCLLNHERTIRGLVRLRTSHQLGRAGESHGSDMVSRQYFDHYSPTGSSPFHRARRTGYMRRTRDWRIGENLAWGTGVRSTPASIVAAWMASPEHRRNILTPGFRHLGVAVVPGRPTPAPTSSTEVPPVSVEVPGTGLGAGVPVATLTTPAASDPPAATYVHVFGRRDRARPPARRR